MVSMIFILPSPPLATCILGHLILFTDTYLRPPPPTLSSPPLHSSSNFVSNGSLLSFCNSHCACNSTNYEPVCGADDHTYFSPCRAGCMNGSHVRVLARHDGHVIQVSCHFMTHLCPSSYSSHYSSPHLCRSSPFLTSVSPPLSLPLSTSPYLCSSPSLTTALLPIPYLTPPLLLIRAS